MKILIWDKGIKLRDTGGPSGYLYKLHEYLKGTNTEDICFYSDRALPNRCDDTDNYRSPRSIKEKIKNNSFVFFLYEIWKGYFSRQQLTEGEKALLEDVTAVHFHTMVESLQFADAIHSLNKKVILTTHTPEPFTVEFFNHGNNNGKYSWMLRIPFLKYFLIRRELKAYDKADVILFPVPQAREAYTEANRSFKKKFDRIDNKFCYVPTAINETFESKNEHVLDNVVLSEENLRVCYIGRHNTIKGYDTIKQIAEKVWLNNKNVEFIIGGKESPLYGLKDKRWHELGWVSTYNLMNEVDVFILPNKQTYYDLILLEVMRSSVPIVLTRTGGNKWFEQYDGNEGLFFYDYGDNSAAAEIICGLVELKNKQLLKDLGEKNKILFKETSTFKQYIVTYTTVLRDVL